MSWGCRDSELVASIGRRQWHMAYAQGEDREIDLLPTASTEQVKTFRGFNGYLWCNLLLESVDDYASYDKVQMALAKQATVPTWHKRMLQLKNEL